MGVSALLSYLGLDENWVLKSARLCLGLIESNSLIDIAKLNHVGEVQACRHFELVANLVRLSCQ